MQTTSCAPIPKETWKKFRLETRNNSRLNRQKLTIPNRSNEQDRDVAGEVVGDVVARDQERAQKDEYQAREDGDEDHAPHAADEEDVSEHDVPEWR